MFKVLDNQMKAYCECYPNQSKKLYAIDKLSNLSNLVASGKILAGLMSESDQGILV